MRVLWLSNQMPPAIAQILGRAAGNKEGWLTGLLRQVPKSEEPVKGRTEDFSYFGFF